MSGEENKSWSATRSTRSGTGNFEAMANLSGHIDLILAEGELVAYRLTSSGTHTRDYFGVEPTGKTVTLTEIYIDRIRDGKIVETWFESFGQGYYYQLTGRTVPVKRRP
jgi:predicted ester cyclase